MVSQRWRAVDSGPTVRRQTFEVDVMEANGTWSRLDGSERWERLSVAQRAFVAAFVASSSALTAVRLSYKPATETNVRAIASQVEHHATVQAAVDLALNREAEPVTHEQLITETRRQLRRAEPGSVAASRLNAQLERLTMPDVKPAEDSQPKDEPSSDLVTIDERQQTFSVGAVVDQNGHRFKIVAEEIA
jgi:hypothetical protein